METVSSSGVRRETSLTELPTSGVPSVRNCEVCNEPIPQKRLQAIPTATKCVPCLEASGDVLKTRRYDEYTPSGDKVETFFRNNNRIERQMRRVNSVPAPDLAFNQALGDDSHLTRSYEFPLNPFTVDTLSVGDTPQDDALSQEVRNERQTNAGKRLRVHTREHEHRTETAMRRACDDLGAEPEATELAA